MGPVFVASLTSHPSGTLKYHIVRVSITQALRSASCDYVPSPDPRDNQVLAVLSGKSWSKT